MEESKNFIEIVLQNKIFQTILVLIISLIIYSIITRVIKKKEQKSKINAKLQGKEKTYIKMISNFIKYAVFIIVFIVILQINGIDVSSMVAGLGVVGIIVGFIVQDAFKDIIRGVGIISDSYFKVGDIVKYNSIEGKVLSLGIKTTKIQDIRTQNIISIANRNIEQIEILSNMIYINIPLPYELKVAEAEIAVNEIVDEINKENGITSCSYKGVNNLGESSIDYLIAIECDVNNKLQVRRDALRTILLVLEKHNISVPYNQIDVHTK